MLKIYFDSTLINTDYYAEIENTYKLFTDNFYLGSTSSNTFNIKIDKRGVSSQPSAVTIYDDTTLLATLQVDNVKDDDCGFYVYELVDKMVNLNFNYNASEIFVDGKTTLLLIAQDICSKAGITLNTTDFRGYDKEVSWYDNRITAREYIGFIAELNGGYATIGTNGELYFNKFTNVVSNTINILDCDNVKVGSQHKISKVVYELGELKKEYGDDTYETLNLNSENVYISTNSYKYTETGNPINITNSIEEKIPKITLDGRSTQTTYTGKNLLEITATTQTVGGVTITINQDKSITLNGTSNALTFFNINTNKLINVENNKTYTAYLKNQPSGLSSIFKVDSLDPFITITNQIGTATYTGTTSQTGLMYLFFATNKTFNNVTIYPMIMEGTKTIYEVYEPYVGGIPSPNPNYPQEIESIKARNLFTTDSLDRKNETFTYTQLSKNSVQIDFDDSLTNTWKNFIYKISNLKPNTDYYFNYVQDDSRLTSTNNSTYLTITGLETSTGLEARYYGYIISFNTGENTTIEISISSRSKNLKGTLVINNMQLEEGTKATPYVPYQSIETKIEGKNLLNNILISQTKNGITFTVNSNKSVTVNGTATANILLNLCDTFFLKIGTYKLSGCPVGGSPTTYRLVGYVNGVWPQDIGSGGNVFVRSDGTAYFAIQIYKDVVIDNLTFYPQLELSSTVTTYEPYHSNSAIVNLQGNKVCSLPNGTKDELVVENGQAKIIKKVGRVVLDGSESWLSPASLCNDSNMLFQQITSTIDDAKQTIATNRSKLISNNFNTYNCFDGANTLDGICYQNSKKIQIRINRTELTTQDAAGFKTWLSTHNTEVLYELETPVEIPLGEVTMPSTYEGISSISNSEDTNMEVEYFSQDNDVKKIYDDINSFEFYNLEVKNCPINYSTRPGQIVKFTDGTNNYPTIANNDFTYFSKWLGGYKLELENKKQQSTEYKGNEEKYKSLKIVVDRDSNLIQQTIGEVTKIDVKAQENSTAINNNYDEIMGKFDNYLPTSEAVTIEQVNTEISTSTYTKREIATKLTDGSVTMVKTMSNTFDENGLLIERSGAKTKGLFNEVGLDVKDTTSNRSLLFAGYDNELKETIVRAMNMIISKYIVMGLERNESVDNLWRTEVIDDDTYGELEAHFYLGGS